MLDNLLFTIIVPVYNVEQYLRQCLDSLLRQKFKGWEAICVDDGSTDRSGLILDEYVAKDCRFCVYHRENAGVSAARNLAISKARGLYVAFLDADDVVQGDWLYNLHVAILRHGDVDWVRTWHKYLYQDNDTAIADETKFKFERVGFWRDNAEIAREGWWRFSRKGMLCINIYKRTVIGDTIFDVGLSKREDTCFCATLLPKISTFACINDSSYLYRQRAESAAHAPQPFAELLLASKKMAAVWRGTCSDVKALTANIAQNFNLVRNSSIIKKEEYAELRKYILGLWHDGEFSLLYSNYKNFIRWSLFLFVHWDGALSLSWPWVISKTKKTLGIK